MSGRFASFRKRILRRPRGRSAEFAAAGPDPRPRLIVGLGNPGEQYGATRHNVGTWCVQALARRHGATFRRSGRMRVATVRLAETELHLAHPTAFVNESGGPVAAELRNLAIPPESLLVVYDDLDLPVGQLRIRPHGGHGGHNGMRSIVDALGGRQFARIRIGIDRPHDDGGPVRDPERIAGWVLSAPSREERAKLDAAIERAADAIELAVREGLDIAMNRLNPGSNPT